MNAKGHHSSKRRKSDAPSRSFTSPERAGSSLFFPNHGSPSHLTPLRSTTSNRPSHQQGVWEEVCGGEGDLGRGCVRYAHKGVSHRAAEHGISSSTTDMPRSTVDPGRPGVCTVNEDSETSNVKTIVWILDGTRRPHATQSAIACHHAKTSWRER
jgi:hypothetical protein